MCIFSKQRTNKQRKNNENKQAETWIDPYALHKTNGEQVICTSYSPSPANLHEIHATKSRRQVAFLFFVVFVCTGVLVVRKFHTLFYRGLGKDVIS